MAFVQLSGVSLAYGDRDILKEVNFNLDSNARVALAGANGSGKSTLMKIMAGLFRPDSGEVSVERGARVGYLPQSGIAHEGRSLREEVESAFDRLHSLVAQKEEVEARLGKVTEASRETEQLLLKQHELQEALLDSGYYGREEAVSSVLQGLGFSVGDLGRETSEFSGGWQMRIALAKLLLERPELLLLDEPTNYLDLEARTWLEGYLRGLAGGYLIVSHDRYFLDVTVDAVAELWNGRLKLYRGNYSGYEKRRGEELAELLARYEAQVEEIARTEEFINRFRYNASKAQLVQSRIKQLERIERIEIPDGMKRMRFSFPAAPHSGKNVLVLERLSKSYGKRTVLSDFSLTLNRGEKLVIVGRNGAGKSTLMRLIAGIDGDHAGSVRYGTGVELGYFSQEFESHLDPAKQVLEEIEASAPTSLYPRLRDLLGAFLFRGDEVFKAISVLSGGEKSRVALLKLLLVPTNLLVLDEPTNHLDLNSKDVLLEALQRYEGTLIFVSHDRYFIEKLATKVLELRAAGDEGGAPHREGASAGARGEIRPPEPRLFYGDYDYYLWKSGGGTGDSGDPPEAGGSGEAPARAHGGRPLAASGAGSGAIEGVALPRPAGEESDKAPRSRAPVALSSGARRRLEREREALLTRLEELERRHAALSEELSRPEVYADGESVKRLTAELAENSRDQEATAARWERIEGELSAP